MFLLSEDWGGGGGGGRAPKGKNSDFLYFLRTFFTFGKRNFGEEKT